MKFKYVGDKMRKNEEGKYMKPETPPFTTVYGVYFELNGEAKEVPDRYIDKFKGNITFVEEGEEPEKSEKKSEEAAQAVKAAPKKRGRKPKVDGNESAS